MLNKPMYVVMLAGALVLSGCGDSGAPAPAAPAPAEGSVAAAAAPTTPSNAPKGVVSPLDAGTLTSATWTGAACSLDTVDGNYSKDGVKLDRAADHVFRGWVLNHDKQPAGKFSVVLKGAQDYAIAANTGEERKDVGEYFKNPALATAGFSVSAGFSTVAAGNYSIEFLIQSQGKAYFCDAGKSVMVD